MGNTAEWAAGYNVGYDEGFKRAKKEYLRAKKEYFARGLESAARSLRRKESKLWTVQIIARFFDRRARKVRKGR